MAARHPWKSITYTQLREGNPIRIISKLQATGQMVRVNHVSLLLDPCLKIIQKIYFLLISGLKKEVPSLVFQLTGLLRIYLEKDEANSNQATFSGESKVVQSPANASKRQPSLLEKDRRISVYEDALLLVTAALANLSFMESRYSGIQ